MDYPLWMMAWRHTKQGDFLEKEELIKNEKEADSFSSRYFDKIIKTRELRVNHGFAPLLDKMPKIQSVITTPKKNDANATWYNIPLLKYFIWPLLVLLIGAYLVYLFGWV